MSVSNGRAFLAIPGPTTVPDEVLAAMHRPAIDLYSGTHLDLTASLLADLPKLFRTRGHAYIYAANGHGAWEAALANVLSRGDRILVLESGRFATGWGEMAAAMGVKTEVLPCDWHSAVDPQKVEERLRADATGEIKAILVVQVDTASSVANDIEAIRAAIDAAGHDALLMVDAVASLATMPFEMDAWGIDVTVTGSQKGLMTPPGLAFVAASDKARQRRRINADLVTRYWDWTFRDGNEHYMKYCGTPPEHLLFGLRKALDMIFAEGLENVITRHRILAEAVRAAVARWAEAGALSFNITDPARRANSVTTVRTEGFAPKPLLDYARDKCGVTIGIGIGGLEDSAFRIAHMGHINAPMVLGTLGVIETGLTALAIPHGAGGLEAAVTTIAKAVKP
jgi:alanine-glyoxylate transaminase/serine-glyoxylate transaminase/serine-pyruvate transaminase